MNETERIARCSICSQLGAQESAYQKYGWAEDDTHLPESAYRLVIVKDLKPNSDRKLQLQQCPECGTYYEYKTDYEYLVNGTEDEQHLTRLSGEEAEKYLQA